MKKNAHHPQVICGIVTIMCGLMFPAHGERLLEESFENFDSNNKPIGWQSSGHPSYLRVRSENDNNWTTPFGEHAMSTYSNGIGTRTVGLIPSEFEFGPEGVEGEYVAKFHISSSAAIGEYRAELWVVPFFGDPILLAHKAGNTDGSKDFSYTDEIRWRYDYDDWFDPDFGFSMIDGADIQLKLMQDPNRSNWRHTPVWDNVTVDYIPDIDNQAPLLVDITDDKEGIEVIATHTVVTYTVTFNEAMNPATVGISDFANSASSDVTILSVTPILDDTAFLVEVVPTSEGTLRLKIQEGAVLEDVAGNALNTSGSLLQATSTFTVEAGVPTILPSDFVDDQGGGPIPADTLVTYTLTFSKDMDGSTVSAADFGNAGSAPITIGTIAQPSPEVFTVEVTPTGSGTLQFRINAGVDIKASDGASLDTSSQIADDTTIIVDSDPPTLEDFLNDTEGSPVAVGELVTYDVFFSEAMDAATVIASDFGNAITVDAAPFTIDSVEQASAAVFRIEITPTGPGFIQLQINAGATMLDLVGNALDTSGALVDDSTITVGSGGVPSDPFLEWSGGAPFDGDASGDGIPNGLAWLLGADDLEDDMRASLPGPIMENGRLILAFYCLKPEDRGDALFKVQFSNDLGQTSLWTANEADVPGTSGTFGNIVFDISDEGPLHYVEAKMDVAGGKMFGRVIGEAAQE